MLCRLFSVFSLFVLLAQASLSQEVLKQAPVSFPVGEAVSELKLQTVLHPGAPIAAWKAAVAQVRATGDRLPDRLTVATATLNYEDGSSFTLNLRYGESVSSAVRDWWNPEDGFIHDLAFADVISAKPQAGSELVYDVTYETHLLNPQPGKKVESVVLGAAPGLGDGKFMVVGEPKLLAPVAPAYFVSPDGNDDAAGSFEKPWATLGKAAATIQAGDTVYVRGGTYIPTRRIVFQGLNADAGNPTQIIGWPGETATFDFLGCHWDQSPDREQLGFEHFPHDVSVIHLYQCDGALVKNLHLIQSRSRGFGAEECKNTTLAYNFVFRSYGPGIRFANITNGKLIGNTVIRPTCIGMGSAELATAGEGPVAFQTGDKMFIEATAPAYMPEINKGKGEKSRKPPMEGIDCGKLWNVEMGYNEIAWGDKEHMLIDGDVDGLRVHHTYVHDAYNLPWAAGIGPNGYGEQQNIEIDHNIILRAAGALGVGTEGGGLGKNMRFHHNVTCDNAWNSVSITGAWGDKDADLTHISVYNNTSFHDGYLDSNNGPAGSFPISFSSGKGKVGRKVSGVVEDIIIANNLIIQPRDYAVALVNPRDLEACRIEILDNATDLTAPSTRFDNEKNKAWHPYEGDGVAVIKGLALCDPTDNDFRPVQGVKLPTGVVIGKDGKIEKGTSYIGAFGPGANWVELD